MTAPIAIIGGSSGSGAALARWLGAAGQALHVVRRDPTRLADIDATGGVEGLTLARAAELAPRVRVDCVAPSLTRTPLAAFLPAPDAGVDGGRASLRTKG